MEEDIKKLLEDNLRATEEMKQVVAKTGNYLKWLRVMDILKILLIVLPLIAAWIYLPQFLEMFTAGYGGLIPGLVK